MRNNFLRNNFPRISPCDPYGALNKVVCFKLISPEFLERILSQRICWHGVKVGPGPP